MEGNDSDYISIWLGAVCVGLSLAAKKRLVQPGGKVHKWAKRQTLLDLERRRVRVRTYLDDPVLARDYELQLAKDLGSPEEARATIQRLKARNARSLIGDGGDDDDDGDLMEDRGRRSHKRRIRGAVVIVVGFVALLVNFVNVFLYDQWSVLWTNYAFVVAHLLDELWQSRRDWTSRTSTKTSSHQREQPQPSSDGASDAEQPLLSGQEVDEALSGVPVGMLDGDS